MRVVPIERTAYKPLRSRGLKPIYSGGEEHITKRNGHGGWHLNRSHARNQSHCCQSRQGAKLTEAERAIRDARIFVNVLKRRKEPKFAGPKRATECADSILPRERLFWIRLGIVEHIARIEGPRTHLVNLENLADEELRKLEHEFQRLRKLESAKVSPAAGADTLGDGDQRMPPLAQQKSE